MLMFKPVSIVQAQARLVNVRRAAVIATAVDSGFVLEIVSAKSNNVAAVSQVGPVEAEMSIVLIQRVRATFKTASATAKTNQKPVLDNGIQYVAVTATPTETLVVQQQPVFLSLTAVSA